MDREELTIALRDVDHMSVEDCFLQSPLFSRAADMLDQQATRIAELEAELAQNAKRWTEALRTLSEVQEARQRAEAERDDWKEAFEEQAYRAEKAEAGRDEARARFNDKDLCMNGQAPCEDLLAAERTAYTAGWIAGRDAAATELEVNWGHVVTPECRDAIRALTPPEDKP